MSWMQRELGVRLVDAAEGPADRPSPGCGEPLGSLVSVALRRNPRRAHLLVSAVLGKHIPVAPATVLAAAARLGRAVRQTLGDTGVAYVLGYAETATALGHCVAAELAAPALHSTRRDVPGVVGVVGFDEEHSHASAHRLLPQDPALLSTDGVVVLVDDEISTGRTALNTVRALQGSWPRARYVLAGLVDVRGAGERAAFDAAAASAGVRIDVVALATGRVDVPVGVAAAGAALAARIREVDLPPGRTGIVTPVVHAWPVSVRAGARHGFSVSDDAAARAAADDVAACLAPHLGGPRVLVLGCEELMYGPLLVADAVQRRLVRREVLFSSTTRSPVVAVDAPDYPIRTRLCFPAHDGPDEAARFAYNVAPARDTRPFDDIVVVVDDVADRAELHDGLLAQLHALGSRIQLVVLPSDVPANLPVASA